MTPVAKESRKATKEKVKIKAKIKIKVKAKEELAALCRPCLNDDEAPVDAGFSQQRRHISASYW